MFIKNPFKTNVVILLLFNELVVSVDQSEACFGSDIGQLNEDCAIINGGPLVFKGTEDVSSIRQKVRTIKEINGGIEIIGTDYESFDFFNGTLQKLRNENGPALTLRENSKLKRIHFDSLEHIEGKGSVILLDKTHFTKAASENDESLYDIIKLASIHQQQTRGKLCYEEFVKVTGDEFPEESNLWEIIGFGVGYALLLILAGILSRYTWKRHCVYKNLKANKKEDPEAKDGKTAKKRKSGDVEGAGDTAKKAPSLQGKIDEDPKKK